MEVKFTADHYDTDIEVTLPNGMRLDISVSCTPEIGHDRYRLTSKTSVGFRVLAESEFAVDGDVIRAA